MLDIFRKADDTTRRAFLTGAARTLLGVGALRSLPVRWMPRTMAATTVGGDKPGFGSAKRCIYLFMRGGMSHLDTFDTKPGADTQGPVESIASSADGVQVSQFFPRTARQMHHVAVINSLNSNQGAHQQGQYFMHTSYFLRGTISHPDLGAWSSYFLGKQNPLLPCNVKIGGSSSGLGGGFLESKHAALPIGNPNDGLQNVVLPKHVTNERFQHRWTRLEKMNQQFVKRNDNKKVRAYADLYDEAVRLMRSQDLAAFDISAESQSVRERYGETSFGRACLLARRLIEHDVRFVEVDNNGWDTHNDNFERVAEKGADLDQGLAALLGDLSQRGLMEDTLVVLATEFGRSPTITANNNGRNHHPAAFTCLLAGAGIRGGIKFGATDKEGREVDDKMVTVTEFNATIGHALGLPLEKKVFSPSGRPFSVGDDGKPVLDLFG